MEFLQVFREASLVALASMFVSTFPLFAGIAYLVRPSEQRLAMLRPISLAGLFAALAGWVVGLINVLRGFWIAEGDPNWRIAAVGTAESFVPLFLAFGCLTVAWLCVAIGFKRAT